MKKRILSIVLAVLMLVSVLPISALAADAEPPIAETGVSTKISENTTGPKLEKSAEWVDEKAGIAKITIKVTGEQPTETAKKTDIVLVLDRSLSMTQDESRPPKHRDWLDNAKKAAKAFAKKVLTGDSNVRIAVVAYAAKTINDWDFSSSLETVEQHIDAINTDNFYYNGQWYPEAVTEDTPWGKRTLSTNWHGTNIQAGIHSARERFKSTGNKDADKFMIVLADGEPNYRFTYKDWGYGTTFNLTNSQKKTYHINDWFNWLFYATDNAFDYNEVKNTEEYAYTATVSEAYAAKATDGITCYSIGYGIPKGSNWINALMDSIASTDKGFVNAGTSENAITKVFSDIATDIQYKAYDVTLTDTMGTGFTYLANETYQPSPAVTASDANKTVTWDVVKQLGNETKTLTFYVQYDKQNLTEDATLPTNTSASLSYKDSKGNAQTDITVDSPEIENLAKKVTYVDENDNAYTDEAHKEKLYWYGDKVDLARAPQKDGYTFSGWTTDDVTIAKGDTSFEMPKQNVTLKASWIKNEPTTKTITVTKVWDTKVPEDKKIPVQVNLVRNDILQTGDGAEFILKESNEWTVTLAGLQAKDAQENEIEYSFREYKIGGFFVNLQTNAAIDQVENADGSFYSVGRYEAAVTGSEVDGFTVTNSYAPYQHNHKVEYEFVGETPDDVTELADATDLYYGQRIALANPTTEEDGWTFHGWYSDAECTDKVGNPDSLYEVTGDAILYGEWTKNTPTTTTIKVTKQWGTGVTDDQMLPVVVRLLDNYGVSKWTDIVLDEDNEWKGTFTVDYDADAEYSVIESKIGNAWFYDVSGGGREAIDGDTTWVYTVTGNKTDGFTITNSIKDSETPEPPTGTVKVDYVYKTLDGVTLPDDALAAIAETEYKLPDEKTVNAGETVNAPATPTAGDKVTVDDGEWEFVRWDTASIENISDDATFTGYWKFTAKEPEETIDITVHKSWAGLRWGYDIKEPENITIELRQNGTKVEEADVKQTERWTYTFENLPKYESDGTTEINYSVIETKVDGDENLYAFESRNDVIGTWEPKVERGATDGIDFEITNTFKPSTPEPEDHEFTAHIVKRFENKSGTSPKATFTFIAALEDGTEVGSETISFSKGDVDAGDFETKDVTMNVTLTDDEYNALERDEYGRYLWIYEEDGDVNGVKYDTKPQKAYIIEAKPWSLELDEDGALTLSAPNPTALLSRQGETFASYFAFTNTYKKPGEKGETIKSGPQLNRDDHVAYIMGYPDGTVQPEGEITRAEACTIFFRLLTDSSRDYYFARTNDYSDVNAGDWFNNAISTLSNAGIVTGYNDGTFRPNQPITRGEMAKIIANFANLSKGGKTFTDLAGHWSKTYVELAAGNGWIAGYPDGSFRPDQKITRAETVTMINRVLDRVPAKESRLLSRSIMLTFPDNNPGDWYYIAIQEASNSHEYQRSVYEAAGDEMWTKLIENVDWTKLEK